MKTISPVAGALLSIVLTLAAAAAKAGDPPLPFVHALQENGYGDVAVEYLKMLQRQPDLPAEVRDVWDLEMARSLKTAAASAFDAKDYEALMAESQTYLAKFIKEQANHPEAMTAIASWADFVMKRALEALRQAKTVEAKDKKSYEKLVADARAGLNDARDKFQQSQKKFLARLAELPPPKPANKRANRAEVEARQRVEVSLHEAQFQLALIDYYLAQTYLDPKSADRTAGLKKAAQGFDDLYQLNRGSVVGLYAHMWHGKTAEELGDLQTALDIYDEVLANAPEPTERNANTGLEPLFTQVERFRLMIVQKQKPLQFLPEATAWLKDYQRLKQTEGYQGIALDVARAMLDKAGSASSPKKSEMMGSLLKTVTECAKIRSPYQQELVLLRREILAAAGRDAQVNSFDEAVALGDSAVASADWSSALDAYGKALELAEKTKLKNPTGIAAVREAMGRVRLMLARDLFNKGKLDECVKMAGKIVHDEQGNVRTDSAAAAQASALGVSAMLNLYVATPEARKPAALGRLMKLAEFTEKNWPDRPEADDARMARGQAKLVVAQARPAAAQVREAIAIFERVNPKSERYPVAMYLAGETYWRLYLSQKLGGESAANKDQMAADHGKAEQHLGAALDIFKKQCEPGKPMPRYMLETQLLVAEMNNEAGRPKEAAALYQPLVDVVKAAKPQTFDNNTIRIFLGAVRSYCTLKQLDKAGEASNVLVAIGPDTLAVNEVLVEFAKLLNLERKKADARVTELEVGINADELKAAQARLASLQDVLGTILLNLSKRQQLGLGQMIFIGQTLNTIGKTVEASQLFQQILKRTETDPDFAQRAQKALSLIRTELLKALRKQEQYEEALKQVDQYIKENPRALEPLMEKGRILEAWAEKEPAKFDQAVGHWALVRTRLQPMKKKPSEYYEVMYNVAKCLVREAEKSTDKAVALDRAKKAEQVLKAALVLSPKLNGPDTIAKYKVLLDKAITMQGRSPDQKVEKKVETKS